MKNLCILAAILLLLASCHKDKQDTFNKGATTDTVAGQKPSLMPGADLAALPPPFNTLDFDRAVAYDYGDSYDGVLIVDKEGRLDKSVLRQKELTAAETTNLLKVLGSPGTYGNGVSDCFAPHLGLVLYKGRDVVFHASICIACNYLKSSMAIPAMVRPHTDPKTGKELFGEGFSRDGQHNLETLCSSLKFSHCIGQP